MCEWISEQYAGGNVARSKDAYGTRAPKGLVLWMKHWAKVSAADLMVWPTHRTEVEHIGKQDKQAEHQTIKPGFFFPL